MSRRVVRGLAFDESGAVVMDYVDAETDLLENGLLLNHSLQIPPTDEFDEQVAAVEKAVHALLDAALAAFQTTPVLRLDADEDTDNSPYDNPKDGGTS